MTNFKVLESKLNYVFKNKKLLTQACTHSSLAYEKKQISNERLEFFGDSILQFVVTQNLFNQTSKQEGELTKLRSKIVSGASLAKAVDDLGIIQFLSLGQSMQNANISNAIKCDFYEALVCAIYLDGGLENAKIFIDRTLKSTPVKTDYKTCLQEKLQQIKNTKIEYVLKRQTGKAHNPEFEVDLVVNGKTVASGKGKTKQEAEQTAAKNYLDSN